MARPRQISDEQILKTALDCFLELGPAVATDVIASRLEVSSQALLKRFKSKRELFLAAVRPPAVPPWTEQLEAGPDDRSLREQLTDLVNELAEYFVEITKRMSLVRWSNIPMDEMVSHYAEAPPLVGIRSLAEWLGRAHQRGLVRKTDFKAAAMSLLGALHAPAFLEDILKHHPTGHSREEYVNQVVELFVRGLLPPDDAVVQ